MSLVDCDTMCETDAYLCGSIQKVNKKNCTEVMVVTPNYDKIQRNILLERFCRISLTYIKELEIEIRVIKSALDLDLLVGNIKFF